MNQLVWLVTGASSGLGLEIARAVLAAGHKVIATSRNPSKTPNAVDEIQTTSNGKWLELDVASIEAEKQIAACIEAFGHVDVLVNNAGYGSGGPLEDMSIEEIRRQMEVNFFGPVRTMKALIPHMRERKYGTIINITSTEGISSAPAIGVYGASKHAVEGLSESLYGELASFGIRVLLVEPGAMRTDFLDPNNMREAALSEAYKGTAAEYVLNMLHSSHGKQMEDPVRSAQRIVEAITGAGEGWPDDRASFLRLPLSKECVGRVEAKIEMYRANLDGMRNVASSVDFD
jgi:NAD(P)-dependent dehydrogenase (short-subunit alcohol dehydrogenase family)